jgi:hypothetical protein
MADLILLLDRLSTSPLLSRITFPYIRNSTSSVAMLKAILHRIATQPAASLCLLCLFIEGCNTRPLDAEENDESPPPRDRMSLHQKSAQTMFPFLARLPALRRLDFWLTEGMFTTDTQRAEFVVEAKAKLPGVGELSMNVYDSMGFVFST